MYKTSFLKWGGGGGSSNHTSDRHWFHRQPYDCGLKEDPYNSYKEFLWDGMLLGLVKGVVDQNQCDEWSWWVFL